MEKALLLEEDQKNETIREKVEINQNPSLNCVATIVKRKAI